MLGLSDGITTTTTTTTTTAIVVVVTATMQRVIKKNELYSQTRSNDY